MRGRVISMSVWIALGAATQSNGTQYLLGVVDYADGSFVNSNSGWLAAQTGEGSPFSTLWVAPATVTWSHTGITPPPATATLTFALWDLDNHQTSTPITSFLFDGVAQPIGVFSSPVLPNESVKYFSFPVDAALLVDGVLNISLTIQNYTDNEVGIDFSLLETTGGGACCLPNGTCLQLAGQSQCDVQSGVFHGLGSSCGPGGQCIPTVSEWGLIVMVGLVAAAGGSILRKRRRATAM